MADLYEVLVTADLPDDLSDEELAELRWHLGLGPEPSTLTIVTDYAEVVLGENGEPVADGHGNWVLENRPFPALAGRGPAHRIGGALVSELTRREGNHSGWALTSRQEIHADDFRHPVTLLDWLSDRSHRFLCHKRFYEDFELVSVRIQDGDLIPHT
ncbi:hypothetical protein [Actinomadura roseirufa]|uniref:hypothetical protein n=1 Tax=Actinomadura roseirufa TaxID=2094049 RepID=UPI001041B421|nr:hypothetical protein [Actinomadura roseirufa]